jgi:hypothetical protein
VLKKKKRAGVRSRELVAEFWKHGQLGMALAFPPFDEQG